MRKIAYKYCRRGIQVEDLIQEGMIGLFEASTRYKPGKNASFETYASFWIKKRIRQFLAAYSREMNAAEARSGSSVEESHPEMTFLEVKLPDDMPDIERKILHLLYTEGKELSEVADILPVKREKVRQLKERALCRLRKKLTSQFRDEPCLW